MADLEDIRRMMLQLQQVPFDAPCKLNLSTVGVEGMNEGEIDLDLDVDSGVEASSKSDHRGKENELISSSSDSESESSPLSSSSSSECDQENGHNQPLLQGLSIDENDSDYGIQDAGGNSRLRTKNEAEALPPVEPLNVVITKNMPLILAGTIQAIVRAEKMVIISAAHSGTIRALSDGTVMCFDDYSLLGSLFETFGPVTHPLYTVRFNTIENIIELIDKGKLIIGAEVFHVPDLSKWVLTQQLNAVRGSDASNEYDEEVGADKQEFSDDEKEAEYKRSLKMKHHERQQQRKENISEHSDKEYVHKRARYQDGKANKEFSPVSINDYSKAALTLKYDYEPLTRPEHLSTPVSPQMKHELPHMQADNSMHHRQKRQPRDSSIRYHNTRDNYSLQSRLHDKDRRPFNMSDFGIPVSLLREDSYTTEDNQPTTSITTTELMSYQQQSVSNSAPLLSSLPFVFPQPSSLMTPPLSSSMQMLPQVMSSCPMQALPTQMAMYHHPQYGTVMMHVLPPYMNMQPPNPMMYNGNMTGYSLPGVSPSLQQSAFPSANIKLQGLPVGMAQYNQVPYIDTASAYQYSIASTGSAGIGYNPYASTAQLPVPYQPSYSSFVAPLGMLPLQQQDVSQIYPIVGTESVPTPIPQSTALPQQPSTIAPRERTVKMMGPGIVSFQPYSDGCE